MKFTKMNGAGNDFIILDNLDGSIFSDRFSYLARTLCERHLSIGADGLMIVAPATVPGADFRMIFYNSDGSEGEMCGNGARCICRYGHDKGLSGDVQTVETISGMVTGERIDERQYRVKLTTPSLIETERIARGVKWTLTEGKDPEPQDLPVSYVELGNPGLPHVVYEFPFLIDFPDPDLRRLGRQLRWNKAFPKGANVNFFQLKKDGTVWIRTFERGVEDFTYACGTGTGSVAAILSVQGRLPEGRMTADMKGGRLYVDVEREGDTVKALYLTGPTNMVASGEILDEELKLY